MKSLDIAVITKDSSVCTLRFCDGGGDNCDRGGVNCDGGIDQAFFRFTGSGINKIETGLL